MKPELQQACDLLTKYIAKEDSRPWSVEADAALATIEEALGELTRLTARRFPIMQLEKRGGPRSIPWALIAPQENQAQDNHSQTLKRLAERGGLDPYEALAVLRGVGYRAVSGLSADAVIEELEGMVERFERAATVAPPTPQAERRAPEVERAIVVGSKWRGVNEPEGSDLGLRVVVARDDAAGETSTERNGCRINWGPEFRSLNVWVSDPPNPSTPGPRTRATDEALGLALHTCVLTQTTSDGSVPPPCVACQAQFAAGGKP